MPVEIDSVDSDGALPSRADVAIVGGGIIGVSTALFLAERGIKTVLCEKGIVGGEQSSRNWGWCRTMGRDPRELPLAMESLRLWRGMNERIGTETGFRQIGTLYICPDGASLAKREAWLPYARERGLDSRLLNAAEILSLVQGGTQRWAGGLYTPGDGVAEPRMAAPAIAHAARRLGATVMTNSAVRGVETSAGRISAVVTEKGAVACGAVVLAGGVWSSLFCRSLGLRLPQLKVLASVLRTGPVSKGPSTPAWAPGLALRKRLDGGYTVSGGTVVADVVPDSFRYLSAFLPLLRAEWSGIALRAGKAFFAERRLFRPWKLDEASPFERLRILDPAPTERDLAEARARLEETFPVFKGVPTVASWGGMIDATPDLLPVISVVDGRPGLFISSGFSGHGFGIGPGAGRLTADLVSGHRPVVDPHPFRFSRFSDGSSLKPQAGL